MVRAFLYILFFFLFYCVFRLLLRAWFDPGARKKADPEAEELVQDPCCLTYISKRTALRKKISGEEVHFCSEECLRNYLKDRQISGA